ncbi:hypothetical protein [Pseudomonas parafulva]|uniref:hypothetical protein n=1 Tax=Pseudomonas parafulva TaxID=157782 RepID=UPI00073469C7|nr:hypothetical protein [Pseudomonas parafulva]KTT00827.1 hypothetical protein NS212_05565 [Pseudomonas parafulva]
MAASSSSAAVRETSTMKQEPWSTPPSLVVNCTLRATAAIMGRAKSAHPCPTNLSTRRSTVRAGLQRQLNGHIDSTTAVGISTIVEKVEFAEFGFDLCHGDGRHLWMASEVIPQRIAEYQEDVPPAWVTVNLIDARVREQLWVSLTELCDIDLG